MKENYFAV